jgi:hypothetical protein
MTKHIPSDFYVTCATVLLVAMTLQGGQLVTLLRPLALMANDIWPQPSADQLKYKSAATRLVLRVVIGASPLLFLVVLLVTLFGAGGEGLAVWVLYTRSELPGMRGFVFTSTVFMVLIVVFAAVAIALSQAFTEAEAQRASDRTAGTDES